MLIIVSWTALMQVRRLGCSGTVLGPDNKAQSAISAKHREHDGEATISCVPHHSSVKGLSVVSWASSEQIPGAKTFAHLMHLKNALLLLSFCQGSLMYFTRISQPARLIGAWFMLLLVRWRKSLAFSRDCQRKSRPGHDDESLERSSLQDVVRKSWRLPSLLRISLR